ncbi:hypothetical protein [Salinimicrobium sp. HB62]|uniref:hypothetical protein n=1 Tax=Salinimicrobium sp. HB62 TaxID=3077781 RepID=UPI002D779EAD|nr:hypothetical protein [Salinimicrobium sp. HB62]
MKLFAAFCFLGLIGASSSAQELDTVLDLGKKVDSIFKFQIGYVIDSTTNMKPDYKSDTITYKGIRPARSSFPFNPLPLVVLNGNITNLENLDQYKWKDVAEIKVFPKNDYTAMALYGTSARNGLILIQLKN